MEKLIVWHRLASRAREDASEPGVILGWARSVRTRMVAAGGDVLAQISGTVVAAFDSTDATDVLEVALELLDAAEEEGVAVAIGIALGVVEHGAGRAIEIAELLATRAQVGEVVCGPAARERVEGMFLFGRQVSTGVGGPRGSAIDRAHPRRDALGDGIARLGATPIAPITSELIAALVSMMRSERTPAVVLRGPVGAGAVELVAAAASEVSPAIVVGIGSAPGGVVPLASLRYGLARALGSDDAIVSACGEDATGRSAGEVLRSVLRGGLPARHDVVLALSHLFARLGRGERCWVFLTPMTMVDAATLEVLLLVRERGAPIALVARYPMDARLPAGLAEPVHELVLPPLRTSDARAIAESVLGPETDSELARRVAVLGGETPLGVLEIARALISSGDLVPSEAGFVWRNQPRGGATAIPLEEVVIERLEHQGEEARRMLEAVCVAPDGASRDLVEAIAARDGLVDKARQRALDVLSREAWLATAGAWPSLGALEPGGSPSRPQPSSNFIRRVVLAGMPSPRVAELHRFVAEALLERGADDAALGSLRAELGFFEIEGGLEGRGAERLEDIGRLAIEQGYRRAASRIATLLARLGSSAADELSRAAATMLPLPAWEDEEPPPSTEIALDTLEARGHLASDDTYPRPVLSARVATVPPDDGADSFVSAAESAVRARDPEALDRLLERAVASGSDMAAISRIRALADLLRGDVGGARRSLAKARGYRGGHLHGDPRESITEAAVALGTGDAAAAVRLGLRALALTRRAADRKGEIAALRTLAACYRALGRWGDATLIEKAAG